MNTKIDLLKSLPKAQSKNTIIKDDNQVSYKIEQL